MAMWVRMNGLDRYFNSLFMSEGWGDRKIHWQIVRDGKIRLGIAGAQARPSDCDTEVFFTPERFGRWMHLAVVFDPQAKEVRHYANGSLARQNRPQRPLAAQTRHRRTRQLERPPHHRRRHPPPQRHDG
jgi:hypothetical protein